jgi:hypothetical protein
VSIRFFDILITNPNVLSYQSQWTPAGDAFRIGADLNRLESETLPQYFRHSRFQSLVRQLNFYNFRKVNRERTFWIYKHRLFQRDQPEHLHLLRRRTCPGVDGRKNRFSSFSRKGGDEGHDEGDDQQKYSDEDSLENEVAEPKPKKRCHEGGAEERRSAKRVSITHKEEEVAVDLSLVESRRSSLGSKKVPAAVADDDSASEIDERTARREQAHVVSQVAMKLEEYARKAKRSLGRTRGAGGIVTPPLGGASKQYHRSVLSYDDEYEAMHTSSRPSGSATVITDADSQTSEEEFTSHLVSPSPSKPRVVIFEKPPVDDIRLVRTIVDCIMGSQRDDTSKISSSAIASFCMSNAPNEPESEVCAKILGLLSNCDKLAHEFMQYRYALHPSDCSNTTTQSTFCPQRDNNMVFSLHHIWERAASRRDAVRDFKTFAVNYISTDLEQVGFPAIQTAALRSTATVWLKSATANA